MCNHPSACSSAIAIGACAIAWELGYAIFGAVYSVQLRQPEHWRWVWFTSGSFCMFVGLITIILFKESAEAAGYRPPIRLDTEAKQGQEPHPLAHASVATALRSFVGNTQCWLLLLLSCAGYSYEISSSYANVFAIQELGATDASAATLVTTHGIGSITGFICGSFTFYKGSHSSQLAIAGASLEWGG